MAGLFGGALLAITFLGLPLLAIVVLSGRVWGAAWRWLSRAVLGRPLAAPAPRRRQPGVFGFVRSPGALSMRPAGRGLAFTVVAFPITACRYYACAIIWGLSLATATSPVIWWLGNPTNTDRHGHCSTTRWCNSASSTSIPGRR